MFPSPSSESDDAVAPLYNTTYQIDHELHRHMKRVWKEHKSSLHTSSARSFIHWFSLKRIDGEHYHRHEKSFKLLIFIIWQGPMQDSEKSERYLICLWSKEKPASGTIQCSNVWLHEFTQLLCNACKHDQFSETKKHLLRRTV